MFKQIFTNRTVRLSCCLILVTILLLPSAYAQQKDPFEPKLDIILNGNQPEPLFPGQSKPKSDPFRLSVSAIPDNIAPGKNFRVEVMFAIASGYQLYVKETSVTAMPTPGLIFGDVRQISQTFEKKDQYGGTILIYKKKAIFELPVTVEPSAESGPKQISLEVRYLGCTETMCFLPQKKDLEVAFTVIPGTYPVAGGTPEPAIPDRGMTAVEQNPFQEMADRFGPLGVLAAAFIWGILASLTPCVYPMIPVTVSVISAGSRGSVSRGFILSLFYVLGLSLTYAILGTVAAWSGSLFGSYANHPAVRVIVAGVFVILALSMFDLFSIQMPSSLSSRLGGAGSGFVGVFLTGAVAGAVVGPCVGPMLVALLVYIAALGSKLQGFLIMWNFALGMGMLFLVIGTFSGAAASLPKAGMWMEKLKRFFGVLMLAVALYYVEPLLPENVLMLSLGAFLIGIGVFAGAFDALNTESAGRERLWKAAGILFLVLGVGYVARFTLDDRMPRDNIVSQKIGIAWLSDEASALARARQEKKPVMIDFSADWCAACKKLERETFTNSSVTDKSKQFVCLRIDCTDTEDPAITDIYKKYNVKGLPTIFFINALGQPLPDKSVTEFIGAADLMKRMHHVEQGQ